MKNYFLCAALMAFPAATLSVLLGAGPCTAQTSTYNVSVSTDALNRNAASGPFSLDFQLLDGSGGSNGDGNNTVTLSGFAFSSGGSLASSPSSTQGGGSETGSLIALTDSAPFNEVIQPLTPGSSPGSLLSFQLTTTNAADAGTGASPDAFSFYFLDNSALAVPTTDTSASSLFTIDLGAATGPAVSTYTGSGSYAGLSAIVAPTSPVPEASATVSFGLLLGLGAAAFAVRRRASA